jgi:SdrD B-like domain/Ig-like domain CHU_C associated
LTVTGTAVGTKTYTVTCTTTAGCVSGVSSPASVTVEDYPVAPDAINGDASICKGESVSLSATCANGGVPQWYNASGTFLTSGTALSNNIPTANTTYSVACKNTTGCETQANNRRTIAITLGDIPSAPLVKINGTNTSGGVCGGSAVLEGTCATGAIKWSNGATTNQITVTVSGTYSAVCISAAPFNCSSVKSADLVVNFDNVPTTPTITGGNTNICLTKTATLTASACSNASGYKWYDGTTLLSTSNTNTLTVTGTAVGTKTYTVTCTTTAGCVSGVSSPASVTVEDYPVAPTPSTDKGTICKGESAVLSAVCGNGGNPMWYNGTTLLGTTASLKVTPSITTTYSVGCKSTTGCETESNKLNTITITVNEIPTGAVPTAPVVERCGTGTVTLTAQCKTNETPVWYASTSSTSPLGTGTTYTTVSISATTPYYVGCRDNSSAACETVGANRVLVTAKVNYIPNPPASTDVVGGAICVSGTIKLTAKCGTNETPQWYSSADPLNTTTVATGTVYSPNFTATTTYYVGCKSSAGCENMNARTSVTGTVNQNAPAPTSVTSNDSCQVTGSPLSTPTKILLSAVCGSNQTPEWFTASGTPLNVLSTTYMANVTATTTFTVGCKDNNTGCQTLAANRKPVVATVITNITNGGTVEANQSSCGAFIPNKLTNKTSPLGSNSTIEYLWLQNSTGAFTTYDPNDPNWINAGGGPNNQADFQPGTIRRTTSFIRCSRSAGCNDYTGESNIIVITINPVPASPTNVPASGSVCLGETYTIGAVCASGETVKWYDNQSGSSFTTNSATFSKSYVSDKVGTFSYVVSCVNSTNCETVVADRKTITINVLETPEKPTPDNIKAAVCTGETYVLSANCGTGQSVRWYSVVGTTKSVITTYSYTQTVAGIYNYEASCVITATNCETPVANRLQVAVEVKERPKAPTVDPTSSKSQICLGETFSLSATCADGTTARWYDANGLMDNSTLTAVKPSSIGTFTYSVACKSNDATGCETLPSGRKPVSVKVNSIPTAPTSANVSGGAVCGSGTVDLKATCGTDETPVWYNTNAANLTAALTTGSPYKVTVTANRTYFVACKNSVTGCESPLGSRTSVGVIYNDKPVPVATATPNALCVGGNTKLAVTTAFDKYAWVSPNGFTSSAQSFDINNITTAQAGVYTVTVTAAADAGLCTASTTVNVTVNVNPTVTASVVDNTVCLQSSIELRSTANATTGSSITGYSWKGLNPFPGAITKDVSIAANALSLTGNYTVTVTDNKNCTATSQVNVVINPLPTATASVTGGNTICFGSPINLTATGAGTNGTYSWTYPSGFTTATQNPTVAKSDDSFKGTYSVQITDANGCVASATTTVTIDKCLKLGNLVFEDKNNNGVLDAGETGINDVKVDLVKGGSVVASTTTKDGGKYLFDKLEPGDYIVQITAPADYISSSGKNGSASGPYEPALDPDDDKDNDDNGRKVAGQVIQSLPVTLNNQTEPDAAVDMDDKNGNLTVDFGLFKPSSLGDLVFFDKNRDGIQDAGEMGVGGVTVKLFENGVEIATTTTSTVNATLGLYKFENLGTGTYQIEFVKTTLPASYVISPANQGTNDAIDSDANVADGKTGNIVISLPGTNNITIDAGVNCPAAIVKTIKVDASKYCVDQPIVFTLDLETATVGGKSFSWSGPGFSSTVQNPTIAKASLANNGTFTVTIVSNNSCEATTTATVAVIVNALPTASATGAIVCEKDKITLNGEGSGTFSWSGPGSFNRTEQNPSIASAEVINDGVYTLTVTNGADCKATATARVTVNKLPLVDKDPTKEKGSICRGESVIISAVCGNGEVAKWYDANDKYIADNTANVTPIITGNVTTTVSYFVGCRNSTTNCETLKGNRKSVSIVVNYIPEPPTSANVKGDTRCDFGTVNLTAKCGANETPQWYSTATPSAFITAGTIYSPNLTVLGATTFKVGCKSDAGCENPAATRITVTGTVNPLIAPPLATAVKSDTTCDKGTVELTATCASGQTPQWYSGNTQTATLLTTGTAYSPVITATTVFYVACKDDNTGCETLPANRRPVTGLLIKQVDNGGKIAASQVSCGPFDPVAFTNVESATGSSTTVEYLWLRSTTQTTYTTDNQNEWFSIAGGATGETFDPGIISRTTAYIRCSRSAGCKDYTGESNVVIITINPVPVKPSEAKINKASICLGETYVLSGVCASGEKVKWYNNQAGGSATTATSSAFTASFTPTKIGKDSYVISCVNSFNCETESGQRTTVSIDIFDNPPVPDASSDKGVICTNETYVLSGTCTVGTIKWYSVAGTTRTEINTTLPNALTFKPTVAGTHNYEASCFIKDTGCETPVSVRKKISVLVKDRPTPPTEKPSSSKGIICLGETFSLNATCAAGSEPRWYDANGLMANTTAVKPSTTGTFNYSVGCKSTDVTGCETEAKDRTTISVVVDKVPSVVSAKTDKEVICLGQTFTLTATCGSNENAIWYQNTPTGSVWTALTYTPTTTGTFNYYASCKSNLGAFCETLDKDRVKVTVVVNGNPVATASVKDATVCTGSSIELVGGANGNTYSWSGPGTPAFSSTEQNPVIANAQANKAGNYIITVSNGNNCSATAVVSVSVLVNPVATASGNVICANETVLLKSGATLSGTGNSVASYAWSGPSFSSTEQNPQIANALPARTGIYTVLITDTNGCTATATATVVVNILPTAMASSNSPVCTGADIKLFAGGVGTYLWKGPSGYTSTEANPVIVAKTDGSQKGIYTVTVTNSTGCTSTATTNVVIEKCLKLGDLVFDDKNNNGVLDAGETGIDGVKVDLIKGGSVVTSTTTASGGKYLFAGLDPGDYIVQITAPAGFISSTGKNGSLTGSFEPALDPDNDINSDDNGKTVSGQVIQSLPVTLNNLTEPDATADGDDKNGNLTVDFGIFKPSSLGDLVFFDKNRDGIQDAGENGVGNVEVRLFDANNNLLATTTTDPATGLYKFENLGLGTYTVEFVKSTLPASYVFSPANQGDDTKDSDADVANGRTSPIVISSPGSSNTTIDAGVNCPAAVIKSVVTDQAQYCEKQPIQFTVTLDDTKVGGKSFSWKGPKGYTSSVQNPLIANATLDNNGTYTVTVVSNNSCEATTTATVSVTVNALPTVSATGATVCETETINLKSEGNGTFSWAGPGTIAFSSTEQNPSIANAQLINGGTYTVTVKNGNGCTVNTTVAVKINVVPSAPSTATVSKGVVCDGEQVTLSAVCGNGEMAKWYDAANVLLTNLTLTPNVGTNVYSVACRNTATTCETAAAARRKVTVIVNEIPKAPNDEKVSKGVICLGETVSLNATCGTNEVPVWYSTSSTGAVVTALTFTPAAVGTYNYFVSCKSTVGAFCETFATNRKQVTLVVNGNPVATASVKDNTVCTGSSIELLGGANGNTYSWSGPGTPAFSSTEQNPVITNATAAKAGNYIITVSNGVGCSATAVVSVSVLVNPVATASGNVICANETVLLKSGATVTGTGNTVASYAWTGPNGYTANVQEPQIANALPARTGTYTVLITDTNGCTATATATVVVNILPTATASSNSPVCTGGDIKLYAGGVGTYFWRGPSSYTSTEANPVIVAKTDGSQKGIYTVTVTNSTNCTSTATVNVVIESCLKLGDLVFEDKNNNGVLDTGETGIDGVKVDLIKGGSVVTSTTTAAGGKYLFAGLDPGDYIVQITAPAGYISSTGKNGSLTGSFEPALDPDNDINSDDNGKTVAGQVIQSLPVTLTNLGEPDATADGDDKNGNLTVDFGIFKPSSLGDLVFFDKNRDGIQDAGETGVGGVTVKLFENGVEIATTTTSTDPATLGLYKFENLGLGTYTIEFVKSTLPTGNVFSPKDAGSDDAKDSDAGLTDGKTGPIVISLPGSSNTTIDAGIYCPVPVAKATGTTVCLNNKIQITSENISSPLVDATYSWTKVGGGFSSTEQNPVIAVNATDANAGTYVVTMTSKNGCSATSTASAIVVVNALPSATATSNSPVCLNNKLTLGVNTNGTSFSWTGPAGSGFTSTSQNPEVASASLANNGIYTVVVMNGNSCSITTTVNVVVNALPTATATGTEVCVGKTATISVSPAFSSYAWTKVNGTFTNSTQNPTIAISATTGDAGTYQVLVTDAKGCTAIATTTVVVNVLPVPTASNNGPVCVGTEIKLEAKGGTAYSWKGPDNFTSTSATPSIAVADKLKNEGTYTVTVTNAKGCEATATTSVIVNTNPAPAITKVDAKCIGEVITLEVTGGANDKFTWTGSNGFSSTSQNPTVSPLPTVAGTYTYGVTVSGVGGCTGTATTSVVIKPSPTVSVPSIEICAGSTGKLTATGADKYAWSGGSGTFTTTTNEISVTEGGVYKVTGFINGCTATATASVTVNPLPTVTVANVSECAGVDVKLEAKTNATKFTWTGKNFNSTVQSPTIAAAIVETGVYSVTVEDAKGCKSSATAQVTVNPLPTASATAPSKVCLNAPIKLTGAGTGTNFSWTSSNGFTSTEQSPKVTPLPGVGTYTYTVTVKNGTQCTATASVVVVVNALPTASATGTAVCAGTEIKVNVTPTFTSYAWTGVGSFTASTQNPTVTANATAANNGTYQVLVTDVNGCTAIATTSVTVNPLPTATATNNSPVCLGTEIKFTATGGAAYSWKGPQTFTSTSATPSIATAGTDNGGVYTVTVASDKGCTSTATTSVTVNVNPNPVITQVTPKCIGESIVLNVNGGTSNTYSWTGPGFASTQQNPTVNPLPTTAGTYTYAVTVTGTGGCTGTATTSVVIKPSPTVTATSTVICAGATGKLTAGGADSYSWTGGGFTATTASIDVTAQGVYTVIGTTNGCTAIATASVTVNPLPTATASATSPVCVGGKIEFTATGGGTYLWNGPKTFSSTSATPSITTATADNAGTYTVLVTSDKGCTATATTSVIVNTNPAPVATSNVAVCLGDTIRLSVTAGTTYAWSGTGYTSTVREPKIVLTTPGTFTYTVTVSGTGGCTGTATTSVVVNALPTATATGANVCAGNEVKLNVTPTFSSYTWTGVGSFTASTQNPTVAVNATSAINGTYQVLVTDANGCTAIATTSVTVKPLPTVIVVPVTLCAGATGTLKAVVAGTVDTYSWSSSVSGFSATTQDVSVTQAGTYTVIVTKDGCTATASTTVEVKPSITLTVSTASICAGTTGNVEVKGADTYSWTGPGTFSSTGANPVVSVQGTYTVIGTSGGCTASATTSVTVKPNPTVSLPSIAICAGATGTLSANSNATQFLWKSENPNAVFTSTTKDLSVSEAGIYTVGAFLNGCSATATASVIIKPLPTVTVASITLCAGATGTLSANTNADSYSWSSSLASFNATTKDVSVTQAGTYTVLVTKDGCTAIETTTVDVKPSVTLTVTTASICAGDKGTLTASGASSYSWTSSNAGFTATTATIDVTQAGTYTVIGTSGNCSATATTTVTLKPTPTVSVTPVSICKGSTGTLTANSNGDSYSWSSTVAGFTATTKDVSVSQAGTYTVTVTKDGCTATATTTVTEKPLPTVTVTPVTLCAGATGTSTANTNADSYSWSSSVASFNATTKDVSVTQAGTYTVIVTKDGCTATASTTVTVNDKPNPSINIITPKCIGESIGLTVSGGAGNTYSWTGSDNFTSSVQNPTVTPLPTRAGTYTYAVLVSGTGGCTGTATTSVVVKPNPALTITPAISICAGDKATLTASGADTYSWTGGGFTASTASIEITMQGVYSVIGTKDGCTAIATSSVTVKPLPTVSVTPVTLCAGATGTLKAVVTGTVDSYSWSSKVAGFTATTQDVSVSQSGTYIVTVTKDGCTAIATTTVEVKPNITLTVSTASICAGATTNLTVGGANTYTWTGPGTFTATGANPVVSVTGTYTVIGTSGDCTASATTSVTVNPSVSLTVSTASICAGATTNLTVSGADTYTWTGPGTFTATGANPAVSATGTYTVIGTSSAGCSATATTTVTEKATPTVTATGTTLCNGATGNIIAIGADTYAWTGPGTFTATGASPAVTVEGTYTVIGTSTTGCTASATASVIVKPNITLTATAATICAGTTGNVTVTGADIYTWTGPETFTATGASPVVSVAGTYTVFGTSGGCTASATTSVTVNPSVSLTVSTASICVGATTNLTVSGADSYTWTGPGTFTATGANPAVSATGTYTVIGTSSAGCSATATTTVTEKATPTVIATGTTLCNGASGNLTASGADTYSWTGPGTFTATGASPAVTVEGTYTVIGTSTTGCTASATASVIVKPNITLTATAATICAGTTGNVTVTGADSYTWTGPGTFTATGASPAVSVAGTYTVIGTSGDCTASATTSVTVNPSVSLTVSTASICAGATTTLTVSGANTYTWTGPGTFTATGANPAVSATGTYTVIGTSGNCSATATTTVGANGSATITAASQEICTGVTTATLTASGGTTYTWTGPGTFTATGANPMVSVEGIYTVIGTNAGGCVGTATASLTIKANPTVSITGNTTICTVGSTTLTANSNGTYEWTGPNGFAATSKDVSVDKKGLYTVTVSNSGCQATGTVNIVVDDITIQVREPQTICEGNNKTDITSVVTTNSGVQSYSWKGSDGFTSTEASPWILKQKVNATYTLTVVTKAGCTATATTSISIAPAPTSTAAVTFCKGGKATLTATGGFNATFSWTGGATTSSIQVSTEGTYDVTVTDTSGCISKGKFFVTESAAASAIITGNTSLCTSTSTTLTVNVGTTGETYSWTGVGGFTSTSQAITVSTTGDYAVLVKTQEGCEGTAKVTVSAGFTPTAVCGPVCEGDSVRFSATQLGGLTYSWSKDGAFVSSSANPQLLNAKKSDAGVYQVVIIGGGCTATVVATLIVFDRPSGLTATAINATCDGDVSKNDAQVKLTGTFTGLKYDIVEGGIYTGTKTKYAEATDIPANGIVKSSIANPSTAAGTKYTVRVFNENNCYTDYTVTIQQVVCDCGVAKCVPFGVTKTKSGKK